MDSFCFLLDLTSTYMICAWVLVFSWPYSRDTLNGCGGGRTPVSVLTFVGLGMPSMLHDHKFPVGLLLWRSLHHFSVMKGSYTLCNDWGGCLSLNGFPSVKPLLLSWGTRPPPGCVLCTPYAGFLLWPFSCSSCPSGAGSGLFVF